MSLASPNPNRPFMDWPFLVFLFFAVIGPVATKIYVFYNHILYIEPYTWMEEQDRVSAQSDKHPFKDGFSMREPVAGTIARGQSVYPYAGQPEASQALANPLPITEDILTLGKEEYQTFCSVCHGDDGHGKAKLKGNHFVPPSLHSAKLRDDWSDGRLFHVITEGQNLMPSYAKQISVKNRWALVHYLRVLQRSQNATKADLKVEWKAPAAAAPADDHGASDKH